MSLINDLLCDLEARDAPTCGGASLAGLRPVTGLTTGAARRRWLLPVAAVLLTSSAFAVLHRDAGHAAVSVAATAPVAVTTAAAAAAPDLIAMHRPMSSLGEFARSLQQQPRRAPAAPDPLPDAVPAPPRLALETSALRLRSAAVDAGQADPAPVRAAPTPPPAPAVTPRTLRRAGLAALEEQQPDEAQRHFDELVERQPGAAQNWLYLVRALSAQGKDAEAEMRLVEALGAVTDAPPVARELARRMLTRKATAEALKLLEAYRPRTVLDVDHDAFIAAVLQRLAQHERAAERYRAVLAVRPESSTWWVGLAISEEARGHFAAALDAYRHARNIGNLDAKLAAYANQRIAAMQGGNPS